MLPAPSLTIAITSEGPGLSAQVDPRFGRAGGFVVVDPETMACTWVDNGSSQVLAQGAGIGAAEILVGTGARVLLTGHLGPKAWRALHACGMKVVEGVENMTAGEALAKFKAGALPFSAAPDSQESP